MIISTKLPTPHTFIYGLKDPRDDRFYYVGRTNNPQRRNWEHRASGKHAYSAWHRMMHAAKIKPVMVVLEMVSGNGFYYELKWMKKLRADGEPLVNVRRRIAGRSSHKQFENLRSPEEIRSAKTLRIQAAWRKWWDALPAEEKSTRQRAKVNERSKRAGREFWARMTPEQRIKEKQRQWSKMNPQARRRMLEGWKVRDGIAA